MLEALPISSAPARVANNELGRTIPPYSIPCEETTNYRFLCIRCTLVDPWVLHQINVRFRTVCVRYTQGQRCGFVKVSTFLAQREHGFYLCAPQHSRCTSGTLRCRVEFTRSKEEKPMRTECTNPEWLRGGRFCGNKRSAMNAA